jgi:hypothetical protein
MTDVTFATFAQSFAFSLRLGSPPFVNSTLAAFEGAADRR